MDYPIREINDYEKSHLDLIEQRLDNHLFSWCLVRNEDIYDEDSDEVWRSFTFNQGFKEYTFVITPKKDIKFFESGVPQQLVKEIMDAINKPI